MNYVKPPLKKTILRVLFFSLLVWGVALILHSLFMGYETSKIYIDDRDKDWLPHTTGDNKVSFVLILKLAFDYMIRRAMISVGLMVVWFLLNIAVFHYIRNGWVKLLVSSGILFGLTFILFMVLKSFIGFNYFEMYLQILVIQLASLAAFSYPFVLRKIKTEPVVSLEGTQLEKY